MTFFQICSYSKALDAIRKLQNEQRGDIKALEVEVELFGGHKEQARKLRLDKVDFRLMNEFSLLTVERYSMLQDGAEEQKKQFLESARKLKQASSVG